MDASQQRIGLASEVEDVRPPCRRPTDVERMPQPARISIQLVTHLRSLIRVTQHPERLRRHDADSRSHINPSQSPPMSGLLLIVKGESLIALLQRLAELTDVEVRGQTGAVPQDLQIDVPAPVALCKQTSSPVSRLCDPTLRDCVDP